MRLGLELTVTTYLHQHILISIKKEPTHFLKSIQNYGSFDLIVIAV